MVCRAEERFADEIDGSPDFAVGKGNKKSGEATYSDIGVTKHQAHDFRKVRDLGSDKVAEIVDKAVAEGTQHPLAALVSLKGSFEGVDLLRFSHSCSDRW